MFPKISCLWLHWSDCVFEVCRFSHAVHPVILPFLLIPGINPVMTVCPRLDFSCHIMWLMQQSLAWCRLYKMPEKMFLWPGLSQIVVCFVRELTGADRNDLIYCISWSVKFHWSCSGVATAHFRIIDFWFHNRRLLFRLVTTVTLSCPFSMVTRLEITVVPAGQLRFLMKGSSFRV